VICTICGYLEIERENVGSARDPMRSAPCEETPRVRGRCPGCCNDAWTDPRLEATAQVLRGPATRELATTPRPKRSYGVAAAQIFFALGMLSWLFWAVLHPSRGSQVGFAALAAVIGSLVATKGIYEAIASMRSVEPRPLPPKRWHLALPVATHMRGEVHGPARALDGLITAPLTGRRCIAYELGVLADVDVPNREATWLLREQRSVAFAVGTTTFPANAVRLRGPQEIVDPAELDTNHVRRVLNDRAFSLSDTGVTLVECIVEPGDVVTVRSAPAAFGEAFWEMPTVMVHPKTRALASSG
jgi:hypothetical protein